MNLQVRDQKEYIRLSVSVAAVCLLAVLFGTLIGYDPSVGMVVLLAAMGSLLAATVPLNALLVVWVVVSPSLPFNIDFSALADVLMDMYLVQVGFVVIATRWVLSNRFVNRREVQLPLDFKVLLVMAFSILIGTVLGFMWHVLSLAALREVVRGFVVITMMIMTPLIISDLVSDLRSARLVIQSMMVGVTIVSLQAIHDFPNMAFRIEDLALAYRARTAALWGGMLANFLAFMLPFLLLEVVYSRGFWTRILLLGSFVSTAFALVLTYGRSGWIVAVVSLVVLLIVDSSVRRVALPAFVALVGLGTYLGYIKRGIDFLTTAYFGVWYTSGRLVVWRGAARWFLRSPLFGLGVLEATVEERPGLWVGTAHNQYLDILLQGGLVALGGFLLFYFLQLKRAWSLVSHQGWQGRFGKALFASLVGFLPSMFLGDSFMVGIRNGGYSFIRATIYYWTALGVLWFLNRQTRPDSEH